MSTRRTPSGRFCEPLCADAFMGYIKNQYSAYSPDMVRGEDPPDYWLTIGAKRYAVEVTSLARLVPEQPAPIDVREYQPRVSGLCKYIERLAIKGGILRGLYALFVYGSPPIPKACPKDHTVKRALKYIENTRNEDESQEMAIYENRADRIEVKKVGLVGRFVSPDKNDAVVPWPPMAFEHCTGNEGLSELRLAVSRKAKAKSLQTVKRQPQCDGIVLLVYSIHDLVGPSGFKAAAAKISPNINFFDAVYLIQVGAASDPSQRFENVCCLHGKIAVT